MNGNKPKTPKEIVDEIIEVLLKNNLSITDAREILRVTSKKLGNQKMVA